MINDDQLLDLNSRGFVPGPDETAKEFLDRANYGLKLYENWPQVIPYENVILTTGQLSLVSFAKTKPLFDISPDWIPVFFSNYKLMPWQGGAAWIFQENENLPISAFFQMNSHFRNKQHYLWIYDRDELIAHEMSHVGRMMFEEPKFEELIAYRTSNSSFRRFFGSIIQSSTESTYFLMFVFMIFFLDLYFVAFDYDEAFIKIQWLKILPLSLLIFGFFRLKKRHAVFSKALKNLHSLTNNQKYADAIIYRLQDKEIELFAKSSTDEIRAYINDQKSLRWRLISLAYLPVKSIK
jgi:hypothetical protein